MKHQLRRLFSRGFGITAIPASIRPSCHRGQSTYAPANDVVEQAAARSKTLPSGLQRLSTASVLRNVLLGTIITTPILFKPGFAALKGIARSKSLFLNPDVNPLLRAILKPLFYDQFCAGRSKKEIIHTKQSIQRIGYSGVILGYGKEIQVDVSDKRSLSHDPDSDSTLEIVEWEKGNLDTIDMLEETDWLAIKLTGAGSAVTGALMRNEEPPARLQEAMLRICSAVEAKRCRLWIDAEQQVLQAGIDRLTIDLMRRFNKKGRDVVVYNTLQAYLKTSRDKLKHQLALASKEGWTLAIKLVRGAYINNDMREAIHDTKEETDASYNSIVHDLITGSNLGFPEDEFPKMQLFLAGHNPISVLTAWQLVQTRASEGRSKTVPEFGQLQGMGDVLGCQVLQRSAELVEKDKEGGNVFVPKIYKCSTWGSIQECLQYLVRRMVENSSGIDRMKDGLALYRSELKRRLFSAFS